MNNGADTAAHTARAVRSGAVDGDGAGGTTELNLEAEAREALTALKAAAARALEALERQRAMGEMAATIAGGDTDGGAAPGTGRQPMDADYDRRAPVRRAEKVETGDGPLGTTRCEITVERLGGVAWRLTLQIGNWAPKHSRACPITMDDGMACGEAIAGEQRQRCARHAADERAGREPTTKRRASTPSAAKLDAWLGKDTLLGRWRDASAEAIAQWERDARTGQARNAAATTWALWRRYGMLEEPTQWLKATGRELAARGFTDTARSAETARAYAERGVMVMRQAMTKAESRAGRRLGALVAATREAASTARWSRPADLWEARASSTVGAGSGWDTNGARRLWRLWLELEVVDTAGIPGGRAVLREQSGRCVQCGQSLDPIAAVAGTPRHSDGAVRLMHRKCAEPERRPPSQAG